MRKMHVLGAIPNHDERHRCLHWFDESSLGRGLKVLQSSHCEIQDVGVKQLWNRKMLHTGHEHDKTCSD